MSKLHLISQTLDYDKLQKQLARYVREGDQLLFIADSVAGLLDSRITETLSKFSGQYFALAADCQCRGIEQLLAKSVNQISDQEMVKLTIHNQQIISW